MEAFGSDAVHLHLGKLGIRSVPEHGCSKVGFVVDRQLECHGRCSFCVSPYAAKSRVPEYFMHTGIPLHSKKTAKGIRGQASIRLLT